ncbi:MAG TPA: hypothetical protein VNK46_14970 [Nitrospiraceae bacterium]|jgi:hypothetical protein|nr:hypothetical protein [Nitrospiraceae bacterium]
MSAMGAIAVVMFFWLLGVFGLVLAQQAGESYQNQDRRNGQRVAA